MGPKQATETRFLQTPPVLIAAGGDSCVPVGGVGFPRFEGTRGEGGMGAGRGDGGGGGHVCGLVRGSGNGVIA